MLNKQVFASLKKSFAILNSPGIDDIPYQIFLPITISRFLLNYSLFLHYIYRIGEEFVDLYIIEAFFISKFLVFKTLPYYF